MSWEEEERARAVDMASKVEERARSLMRRVEHLPVGPAVAGVGTEPSPLLGLAEASLARGIAEVTAHRDRAAVRSPFNREEALAALRREAASPASPA